MLFYGLLRVFSSISLVFRPFIFALVIVFLLKPILVFLEERGLPRLVALTLTYLFFFALLVIIILFLIPVITAEINQLVKNSPYYAKMLEKTIKTYQVKYESFRIPTGATRMIDQALSGLRKEILAFLSQLPGFTINLLSLLLDFVLAPLIAFFILMDRDRLGKAFIDLLPRGVRREGLYLARRLNTAIENVLRIMLILAVVVAILCSLGLFVMGIPYALLLGFFAGFIQLIPYLGPVIGTIPAALVAWVTKSYWYAIGVAIYFGILTQLASLVLTPIMMKEHVGVHPILVIFVLLLGGALFGFWGVLLAIPAAAVINEIASFMLLSPEAREKRLQEGLG